MSSSSSDSTKGINLTTYCKPYTLKGVKNVFNVLIVIETTECEQKERPGLEVACILDKSGSMSGEKLTYAKRAVSKLVKHLLPEKDCLHLILYDSNVSILFQNGDLSESGKEGLQKKISSISSGSTTNLFGGLEAGAKLLNEPKEGKQVSAKIDGVKRLFLFSDGLVNAGVQDKNVILQTVGGKYLDYGITTSTFGIGKDFDQQLMSGIAKQGKGEYTFLENAKVIPKLVSKSIHGLLSIVGTEAIISVRGLGNCVVTKIYGADDDEDENESHTENDALLKGFPLGDLHAQNTRQVLIQVELIGASNSTLDEVHDIVECELSFLPYTESSSTTTTITTTTRASIKSKAAVTLTDNRDLVLNTVEHPLIIAANAIQQSALLDIDVARKLKENDKQRALELKNESIQALTKTLEKLKTFENIPGIDKCYQRVARVLERSQRTYDNMSKKEDAAFSAMEVFYERRIARAMSDCGYSSGEDSDSGHEDFHDNNSNNSGGSPNVNRRMKRVDSGIQFGFPGHSTSPRSRSPRFGSQRSGSDLDLSSSDSDIE